MRIELCEVGGRKLYKQYVVTICGRRADQQA